MARMFGGNQSKDKTDLVVPQGSNVKLDDHIETTIGSTVSVNGVIKAEGTIRIDGVFEGTIETAANVIIGRTGKVLADIKARNVLIAGRVKGNVEAAERLELVSSGGIIGDVMTPSFYMEEGAIFQGQSRMPQVEEGDSRFLLDTPREG